MALPYIDDHHERVGTAGQSFHTESRRAALLTRAIQAAHGVRRESSIKTHAWDADPNGAGGPVDELLIPRLNGLPTASLENATKPGLPNQVPTGPWVRSSFREAIVIRASNQPAITFGGGRMPALQKL